jgi:hypothetical protein
MSRDRHSRKKKKEKPVHACWTFAWLKKFRLLIDEEEELKLSHDG